MINQNSKRVGFVSYRFESQNFHNSVLKARKVKPLVRPDLFSIEGSSYWVRSVSGFGYYRVIISGDDFYQACYRCSNPSGLPCPAFESGLHCYHSAAALLCHLGFVRSGLRPKCFDVSELVH